MTGKKRGLGRGLDALLGMGTAVADAPPAGSELRRLPVDLIRQGRYQPRVDMHPESLQMLADSIRAQGVVQPVVVRPVGDGRYELIAGERRWRAAQMAGLQDIPAVVRDVPDRAALSMALIENIQRENLNPLEEARALARLIDEFDLTHESAAEAVGRSRSAVSNLLRLLDLAEDVKALLEAGKLEMGHARALLSLPTAEQGAAARTIVESGLSVREAERLIRQLLSPAPRSGGTAPRQDPNVRRLEEQLGERLGARVAIHHGRKGSGSVVIHYSSLEELDGILEHIK